MIISLSDPVTWLFISAFGTWVWPAELLLFILSLRERIRNPKLAPWFRFVVIGMLLQIFSISAVNTFVLRPWALVLLSYYSLFLVLLGYLLIQQAKK